MNDYDGLVGLFWLIVYGCILFACVRGVWAAFKAVGKGAHQAVLDRFPEE